MIRNKVFVTIFATVLLLSGLFLLYTSNINKTLFVDVSAENPLFLCEDKSVENIQVQKNSHNNYIFLLPSNFLYQTKTIYLQNTNNEDLDLKLYTEQKIISDKKVEFSIQINKIKVNGNSYNNKKQTVWYERPYINTVTVNKDEVVSLTVKYKTKLMLRNVFVPQFVVSIFLFLLSFIFFLKCYFWEQTKNFIKKLIQSIMIVLVKHGEWDTFVVQKYRDIDAVYKKTFWTVFILLNLVFLYYNIHFIWGNHDWSYVMNGMWGKVAWWNGRFANYLPNQLLGGRFLPILTVSFALFGYSFTGILLAYYWNIQKTFFNYLAISLIVVLNPLVLYWLYFGVDVISHLWLPSIMILALIISEKKFIYCFIFAYLLFLFGLGIYASGIATIATVLLGKIIIVYCFENRSIIFLFHKFKQTLFCIICSLISHKIIINILVGLELSKAEQYSTQMNLFGGSLKAFLEIIKSSYSYLFYVVLFYDYTIIRLTYGIGVCSIFALFWFQKKYNAVKLYNIFFIAVAICLLPLAFDTTEFIIGQKYSQVRILFYGYIFLGAFFAALILKTKFVWAKNILIVFLVFLLPMNVYRLVDAQKLWKIEFEYEQAMFERLVLPRIQDSHDHTQKQQYSVIMFGEYNPLVSEYFSEDFSLAECTFMRSEGTLYFWAFDGFIRFYFPRLQIKNIGHLITKNSELYNHYADVIQNVLPYYDILKNEMTEWPSTKSVLVKDNLVFINFDNEVLQGVLEVLDDKQKAINETK